MSLLAQLVAALGIATNGPVRWSTPEHPRVLMLNPEEATNVVATNSWVYTPAITTNLAWKPSDDALRELAKSGAICKGIGHVWGFDLEIANVRLMVLPEAIQSRVCAICGKYQTRVLTPWEAKP